MKKIFYFSLAIGLFGSCKSKLDDVHLDTNPYDAAYTGPKIVTINSIEDAMIPSSISHYNKIHVTCSSSMYEYVKLYRNGVFIRNATRTGYLPPYTETISDNSVTSGVTYSYTVATEYEDAISQQSDAVSYTTH